MDGGTAALTPAASNREVGIVLTVGLLVRFAVLRLLPRNAVAFDLKAWSDVAALLASGQNPYKDTPFLSWPPAWMQIVFLLDRLAHRLSLPLDVLIRVFLILVDGIVILLTIALVRALASKPMLTPFLLGWSLNPVAILLVCQHGNFDGLVALCVVAMLLCLLRYERVRDPVSWLWACLWLGAGVVIKTVPVVLLPLLSRRRQLPRSTLLLGAFLAIGPAAYGLSILFVLGPEEITRHVFNYKSFPGWFGVSGLLNFAGKRSWLPIYQALFVTVLCTAMIMLALRSRSHFSAMQYVTATAGLLVAIPALGPGYGPQYVSWFLPLLIAVYCAAPRRLKLAISTFSVIAAVTYVLEYALLPSHGAFLLASSPDPSIVPLSMRLASERGATLVRLPLFVSYLVLLPLLLWPTLGAGERAREAGVRVPAATER